MIITIASFKGGVGKTTTAVHLAAFFSQQSTPEKTLLIDGDPTVVQPNGENGGNYLSKLLMNVPPQNLPVMPNTL